MSGLSGGGGGIWEYLETVDADASVGAVSFVDWDAAYDHLLIFESIYSTGSNNTCFLRTNVGGVEQSGSSYTWRETTFNYSTVGGSQSSGTYIPLCTAMGGGSTQTYLTGSVLFMNQNGNAGYKYRAEFWGNYANNSAPDGGKIIYGAYYGPADGVNIYVNNGALFTGGEFRLYRRGRV